MQIHHCLSHKPCTKKVHYLIFYNLINLNHTHSVLTDIFQVNLGCPLNSPSAFIPGLCILFGTDLKLSMSFLNTIPPGLFRASSLSNFFNFPCYTKHCHYHLFVQHVQNISTFDHQTDWFQS